MAAEAIPPRIPVASGDLATAMLRGMANLVLGCRLTFDEHLDADVLSRATRLILDIEPVLGCWFDEGFLSAEWVRCSDLDGAEYFSVVETDDPDRDAAAFHGNRFEPRGPRLAVRLLRSADHDDMCVRMDHLVGDGWSTKKVAYMLAETYSKLLADTTCDPAPNLTPRPSGPDLWDALTPEQQKAAEAGNVIPEIPKWRLGPFHPGSGAGLRIQRMTLGPDEFTAMKSYGKARSATVNDMVLTGMLRALASVWPPAPNATPIISVTSNLRLLVDQPRFDRVCGLSGVVSVSIDHNDGDDFDGTLRRTIEGVRPHRDSLWGAKSLNSSPGRWYRLLGAVMAVLTRATLGNGKFAPMLVNIGVIDDAQLGFGAATPVSAHICGSMPLGAGFGATVSTYRDNLTVWMGNFEEHIAPEMVEGVLARMGEELRTTTIAG